MQILLIIIVQTENKHLSADKLVKNTLLSQLMQNIKEVEEFNHFFKCNFHGDDIGAFCKDCKKYDCWICLDSQHPGHQLEIVKLQLEKIKGKMIPIVHYFYGKHDQRAQIQQLQNKIDKNKEIRKTIDSIFQPWFNVYREINKEVDSNIATLEKKLEREIAGRDLTDKIQKEDLTLLQQNNYDIQTLNDNLEELDALLKKVEYEK